MWCLVLDECSTREDEKIIYLFMSAPCSLSLVLNEQPVSPMWHLPQGQWSIYFINPFALKMIKLIFNISHFVTDGFQGLE